MDARGATVRFHPLSAPPAPLEAPLEVVHGDKRLVGGLRLRTPQDPLALVVHAVTDEQFLAIAWPLALIAFAELTCKPRRAAPRFTSGEQAVQGPRHDGARRSGARSTQERTQLRQYGRPGLAAGLELSAALRPNAPTARYLASYVAGHRRQLRPGHRHSTSAQQHAKAVGILLADDETWVRPHARGVPRDAELRFDWHAPANVRAALA
jgi:hypothetical protein